jgi:NitT/TauT family transport system substrate-binding protein
MYFIFRRKLFFVASLVFLCISVTACGAATTTSASSTGNNITLTVCQASTSATFFPFYVAQQEGYFKDQHLTIPTPPLLQVGSKVAAAVQAGSCEVGNGLITDAFSWAKTDPSQARVIGSYINAYTVDIIVSKKFEQETHVSASSPLAAKIDALKGKTIGITGPGSSTQGLLTYLFKQQGMNAATDSTQVSLGSSGTTALADLKSGRVDAISFLLPTGQAAEIQGIGDILISPMRGDIPGLKNDVHGVIYTKQSTINANQQAIADYIRAIAQAEAFIQNNPAQDKTLLNSYLGLGQAVTNAIFAVAEPDMAKTPQITEAQYNVAAQFHLNAGLISKIPPYTQLIATTTIANALA